MKPDMVKEVLLEACSHLAPDAWACFNELIVITHYSFASLVSTLNKDFLS